MAETYSLSIMGASADVESQIENVTLPDSSALPGGQARAMSLGTPLQCRGPDGALRWFVLDAERSTPSVPILRAL